MLRPPTPLESMMLLGCGSSGAGDTTPGGATNVFVNEDDTGELNEDGTFALPEG